MNHPALENLLAISKIENHMEREKKVKSWFKDWIFHSQTKQTVLNKSTLNSEDIDFVWEKVTEACVSGLLDSNIVPNHVEDNNFYCNMYVLRSSNETFKKNTKSLEDTRED